jgi:glycosyltransferase involved in cell wall biosynthesis/2-polyprenyl-3-methyl-5-hydroxy-6-metoxy-1,4-benzoquinol methylase
MKIAIDISMAIGESAGVGTYTRGLIDGLAMVDSENEYVLYSYLEIPETFPPGLPQQPNISLRSVKVVGEHWERLWCGAELPPKEALGEVDIIHSPFFNAPQEHHGNLVVTIHDISFLLYPQFHTEANRLHCFNGTLKAALYADRIIAVSQQTKQDLIQYFAIPEDRIRIVHEAPRHFCFPERNDDLIRSTLERLGVYRNFVLFVGSLEPRKNLKTLLTAYGSYVKRHARPELLVIAGGKGWLNEEIRQSVSGLGLEERVRFVGYVTEADLRVLYSAAKLFVYPALYEGFGLPPLEAMACGAPVITSNTSALPEVVGDAALLIDPHNSEELSHAMQRVLCNDALRLRMRQQSLLRARLFSWERAARETLAIYQEVCPDHYLGERRARIGRRIQQSWNHFGSEDPFWAALTVPDKSGGRWSEADFFETGRQSIRAALDRIATLGISLSYEKALDFGCGPGRLAQALAEHFQEVHGVDIAPSMIARAQRLNKHGDRCTYHLNEAPDLRLFDSNTFDMVYSWLVLQHMPKELALRYIAEFARVTKPGGVIVFEVPDRRQRTVADESPRTGDLPSEFWRGEEPLMLMCETPYSEIVKVLEGAGAQVIEVEEDARADPSLVVCYYIARKA